MNDKTRAMLGDKEATKRLTETRIAIPCPFCANRIISRCEYNTPILSAEEMEMIDNG